MSLSLHEHIQQARGFDFASHVSRVAPSSFDPDDSNFCAIPRPLTATWPSLRHALHAFESRGLLVRLPGFWQVSAHIRSACEEHGIPFFPNDPDNIPIGIASLIVGGIDTLLTTAHDILAVHQAAREKNVTIRGWVIVHNWADDSWQNLSSQTIKAAHEVHLFPGVPILIQCHHLVGERSNAFHHSDEFTWDQDGGSIRITSSLDDPLPLRSVSVPLNLLNHGTCPCGKIRYERLPDAQTRS